MIYLILWATIGLIGSTILLYQDWKRGCDLVILDFLLAILLGCFGGIFMFWEHSLANIVILKGKKKK